MSPTVVVLHLFTYRMCAEICPYECRFDPAASMCFDVNEWVFTMIKRTHSLHYFMQFRQIGSVMCRRLYPLFVLWVLRCGKQHVSVRQKSHSKKCWTLIQENEADWRGTTLIISPNSALLDRLFPSANWVLHRTQTSTTFTNFHLCPNDGICICSH